MDDTFTIAPDFGESAGGTLIGSYKLIQKLGEGGMGVVYHAQQLEPIRRDVALKLIKPGMDSRQVIARFEGERQALAMMDHANIARVFDAGTTAAGLPYFVMEWVDGVPITHYCDSKRLTLKERIELFIPVCRAIQHAHQKGIIHRDIKPSNVLVAEQEGRPAPKVIDFGLAKALGHQLSDATMMTNYDTVVGTFQYMSPEQADLGRHDIDTRSDIYSLGAVLYELLAGTTPLEHESVAKASYAEILQRIREEEPALPSERTRRSVVSAESAAQRRTDPVQLPKLLDGELDWITMKALEKDRSRRYETVNGLARDLERFLDGEAVEAAPPSTAYRLGKFMRKHRALLATAAAFTALLVVGVVASSLMAVRASRAEQEARAVNDFLQNDLLAQASANKQAGEGSKPDPDLKVRTALDRAAMRIEGKFDNQPLVEAAIRQTIGSTYKDLGLYSEAQRQLQRALDLRRRVLGEKHPDTLDAMDELGNVYILQGEYTKSEALFTGLIEVERRALGAEHPKRLEGLGSLATVYSLEGKAVQAEVAYTNLLGIQRRVLGQEHPSTLSSMNNLAATYLSESKFVQAEELFANLVEIKRRALGEDHPNTLVSMSNLGAVYRSQGKYAKAEALHSEVLETMRGALGEEHPYTLTSRTNLAADYESEGKFAEAESLYADVVDVRRRVLGPQHPYTTRTMVLLGRVQLKAQTYAKAEPVLRDALKTYEKTKPEAWQRYDCQSMLGSSLAGQRKYAEAEPLLLSGYEGLIQLEPTMSSSDWSSVGPAAGDRIVSLYQNWGKPDKAAEWRQKLQAAGFANSSKRP